MCHNVVISLKMKHDMKSTRNIRTDVRNNRINGININTPQIIDNFKESINALKVNQLDLIPEETTSNHNVSSDQATDFTRISTLRRTQSRAFLVEQS